MPSQVDIANRALIRIGADPINSLTQNSSAANVMNALWDLNRQELLRMNDWKFAMKQAQLAQVTAVPTFEFNYAYALPSDCLRVWDYYLMGSVLDFQDQVSSLSDGGGWMVLGELLLSNSSTAQIYYISDVIDPNQFDSIFSSALALKLAMDAEYRIVNNSTLHDQLAQEFELCLQRAKSADSQEQPPRTFDSGSDLNSRIW